MITLGHLPYYNEDHFMGQMRGNFPAITFEIDSEGVVHCCENEDIPYTQGYFHAMRRFYDRGIKLDWNTKST